MLVLRWGGSRWLAPWWAWNVAIPKSALQTSGLKKAEHVLKRLSFQPRNTYSNGRKPWVEQAERAERTHDCMTAQPDAGQQPWAAPPEAHLSKWWSNGLPTGSAACCRVPVASCAAMAGARDHPSPNAWAFSRGGERGCGGGQKKGKQPCGLSTGSSPGSHNLFGRFQASESLCNPHDPPSHRACLTRSVCVVVWWRGGSFRRQRQATAQRAKPWLHLASFPLFRVSWIRATRAFQKLPFLASYRSCWQRLILIGLTPGFRASALKPCVVSQRAFTDALKLDLIFRF